MGDLCVETFFLANLHFQVGISLMWTSVVIRDERVMKMLSFFTFHVTEQFHHVSAGQWWTFMNTSKDFLLVAHFDNIFYKIICIISKAAFTSACTTQEILLQLLIAYFTVLVLNLLWQFALFVTLIYRTDAFGFTFPIVWNILLFLLAYIQCV